MFSVYDQSGLKLAYPENWSLAEEAAGDARLQLGISSPGAAFWTLSVYDDQHDLLHLARQALGALQAEYPDAETYEVEERLGETQLVGFDLNFIYLDLTITACVRAFERGGESCLVFTQAEDRELEVAAPVFNAITTSLLESERFACED